MDRILAIVKGVAAAGVAAGILFAMALIAGVASGSSRILFVSVALAGVAYGLIPHPISPYLSTLGALSIGTAAFGIGLGTGFGALEFSGVVGSILAASLLGLKVDRTWRTTLSLQGIGLIGIGAVAAALLVLVVSGGTLGHDESAYALKGRSWLVGTPDSGWSLHRAPALSMYAYAVLALGGEEPALRTLGLLATVGLAAATWWLGSNIGQRGIGVLAALGVLGSPALLRRGTEFLSDIPAAALLVVCMTIVWREFVQRALPTYRILWVLPFAWLAFYIRYQSLLTLGLIGLTLLVLWWDRVKARPMPLVVAASVGVLGLVPHGIFSTAETGSPTGIVSLTGEVAGRAFVGEGLIDYAGLMVWPLAGFVGPVALVLFIWWSIVSWKQPDSRRRSLFLLIPAAAQVLVLGIVSHGEARFVFFPLALTVIGGVAGAFELARSQSPTTKRALVLGLSLLLMGSIALSVASVRRSVEGRILSNEPVEIAAETVEAIDSGDSCGVMTSYLPQITFYSSCWTDRFRTTLDPEEAVGRLRGETKFMILIEEGKRQPSGDDLKRLMSITSGEPIEIDRSRDAAIYRFAP